METVVRLEGAVESALESLIAQGFFKTRAEAIRAGILSLAKEYGAMPQGKGNRGATGGSHSSIALHEFAKSQVKQAKKR
jgi:Arc/MetJ-type ribon-helix-helix transcriptional regulator